MPRAAFLREGLLGEIAMPATGSPAGVAPGDGSGRVRIAFSPSGREVRVPVGVTLFDAASWNGIAVDSTCGGHGTCRKCRIQVTGGEVPAALADARAFTPTELRQGWRLACLATATRDLEVDVPPLATRPKAATVGVGRQVILRPAVRKRLVRLAEPTLADQVPDLQRLLAAIDDLELRVDLHAVRNLPKALRGNDFTVTAVIVDDVLIDVEPGDTTACRFGLAFDLGTHPGLGVIMHARATGALPEARVGVVACGALAQLVERLAAGLGLPVDVHPLPPLLHNRPERIAAAVEAELVRLRPRYPRLAVAYAACGTGAALDDVWPRSRRRSYAPPRRTPPRRSACPWKRSTSAPAGWQPPCSTCSPRATDRSRG
jgi:ferredoxin